MITIKTVALSAAIVLATTVGSFAAQYAWADQDAKVRDQHFNGSPTVNWIEEGQKVVVLAQWGNWYKVKIPGQDGWVKANTLDFAPTPDLPVNGGSFCVQGTNASFCLNTSF